MHLRTVAAARLRRRARRLLRKGRRAIKHGLARPPRRGFTPTLSKPRVDIDAALRLAAEIACVPVASSVPLVCFPEYPKNPVPRILYSACWEHAMAPIPVRATGRAPLVDLDAMLSSPSFRSRSILHLHWTQPVLAGASDREDARRRVVSFLDRIRRARDHGARVVWTIHNVLPHESVYDDEEIALRIGLADAAHRVHVFCRRTLDEVADLYPLNEEKVAEIPHPSYLGVYPNAVSRPEARLRFAPDPQDVVLLCLGNLRSYKGLDLLVEAFHEAVQHEPRLRLVVAGERKGPIDRRIDDAIEHHPRISYFRGAVPDAQLQHYFGAADAFVLPYGKVLNSGALMLAFTFGCPVIAPELGCVGDAVDPSVGLSYAAGDYDAFVDALVSAPQIRTREHREAALARAAARSPARVAESIAAMMQSVLEEENSGHRFV